MRLDTLTASIAIFRTVQSAPFLPLTRRPTLSRRFDASTCDFYGYVDGGKVFNQYTIEMAGWGNDESASNCTAGVSGIIQTQCNTLLDNYTCTQTYENLPNIHINFRVVKTAGPQPDCVAEALRLASSSAEVEQTIKCSCLAECWI
ncbi:hypothetical protein F4824DRAFT_493139 [Ustulina deusta]|nr:hypothetical protein F4824DRAFT_493139 [Ustulina deusta]